MNNNQGAIMLYIVGILNKMGRYCGLSAGLCLLSAAFYCASVNAAGVALSNLDVATLAGDKLQIQLEMTGEAVAPKVFHTDNPARIALDFIGVKNSLNKKMFPINQGVTSSIYVAEAADRVRVVVNLLESIPFETKVVGNKVLLTLARAASVQTPPSTVAGSNRQPPARTESIRPQRGTGTSFVNALLPQQTISSFDFKRGDKGEGRMLFSLANPNTIVNSKEEGGKVIVSFLNTQLPSNLSKRLDVSEFATPVKFIDMVSLGQETKVTMTMQNNFYDYSLFQSEGLLTVEFRPLTTGEKEVLEKSRVKYTGERLSLNFQDIEIRSVIAILAEFTGQNVVAGDEVKGNITVKLDDVPWDEALDFVMITKGLEKYKTDNVTLIAPVGKIKEYKEKQKETEQVVEQLEPLVTEYIQINFAKAENFRNLLYGRDTGAFGSCGISNRQTTGAGNAGGQGNNQNQNQNQSVNAGQLQGRGQVNNQQQGNGFINEAFKLLSTRGSAVVDTRTNTLIVRETSKRLEDVKKMIRKLDIAVRQVMIESRIVIANDNFLKELGARFGLTEKRIEEGEFLSRGADTGAGSQITIDRNRLTQKATPFDNSVGDALVDLGVASATPYGALGMTLAKTADSILNLELTALQDQGRGEIISNPRVMTTDRCKATIQQGTQIPFSTVSQNGTQVQFVDAFLQLDVTPQITPSGSIIMDLFISKDSPSEALTGSVPGIDTKNVKTNVRVNDGETVVLGGIFEGTSRNNTNKVPFFGDLPGIGFLFRREFNLDNKSELLIFVTPKVVKDLVAEK
jgi:type IV pilus assembly protein PilQ